MWWHEKRACLERDCPLSLPSPCLRNSRFRRNRDGERVSGGRVREPVKFHGISSPEAGFETANLRPSSLILFFLCPLISDDRRELAVHRSRSGLETRLKRSEVWMGHRKDWKRAQEGLPYRSLRFAAGFRWALAEHSGLAHQHLSRYLIVPLPARSPPLPPATLRGVHEECQAP
jgi:hypothetical protein